MSAPSVTHSQARELERIETGPKSYNLVRIGDEWLLVSCRFDGDLIATEVIARVID